eukprot:234719-Amphidinium_carterae.1
MECLRGSPGCPCSRDREGASTCDTVITRKGGVHPLRLGYCMLVPPRTPNSNKLFLLHDRAASPQPLI